MNPIVRAATLPDLQRMLPQIDKEFILDKGRSISIAQRFPAVFCPENIGNLFLIEENGELLSCLACKCFSWLCDGLGWNGVMIGVVYTVPHKRRGKLASRLLDQTTQIFRKRGFDFAVLWTDQPAFYSRLGWASADSGVFGTIAHNTGLTQSGGEIVKMPIDSVNIAHIERLRKQWCKCYTPRQAENYRQLPLPAKSTALYLSRRRTEWTAYALVGADDESGILYEMIGDAAEFPFLWSKICRDYRKIIANDVNSSPSHLWLTQNTGLVWRDKPLAMWLPLSEKTRMAHVAHWYIPYFDRI